jgi:hypothetical protein
LLWAGQRVGLYPSFCLVVMVLLIELSSPPFRRLFH